MELIQLLIAIRDLYLSCMWLGVDLRMDIKKTNIYKKSDNMFKVCYHFMLNNQHR